MEIKKIVMGSDHAGYNLKLKVKAHLEARGTGMFRISKEMAFMGQAGRQSPRPSQ